MANSIRQSSENAGVLGGYKGVDEPYSSSINPPVIRPDSVPATAQLAVYLPTPQQGHVLVRPSYAAGSFGKVSIWRGLTDRQLYIRKVIADVEMPKEISHTIDHPLVPQMLLSSKCGSNPNYPEAPGPDPWGQETAETMVLNRLTFWSIIMPYVNGPSLESLIQDSMQKRSLFPFPEAMVWQCGADLFDIVRTLQFGPEAGAGRNPISHRDLFARNVLVSTSIDEQQRQINHFHLIDFGLATKWLDHQHKSEDVDCVLRCMLSLMGTRIDQFSVDPVLDNDTSPYSKQLKDFIRGVFYVNRNIPYKGYPERTYFEQWIKKCLEMADACWTSAATVTRPWRCVLGDRNSVDTTPVGSFDPMLGFRGQEAGIQLKRRLKAESDLGPYQVAWLNDAGTDVLHVDSRCRWQSNDWKQWAHRHELRRMEKNFEW